MARMLSRTSVPLLSGSDVQRQIDLEREASTAGVKRYRQMVRDATRRGNTADLKPVVRLIAQWFEHLVVEVKGERKSAAEGKYRKAAPVILSLSSGRIAAVAIRSMMAELVTSPCGVKQTALCYAIGRDLCGEINFDRMAEIKGAAKLRRLVDSRWKNPSHKNLNKMWTGDYAGDAEYRRISVGVGAIMLACIMRACAAWDGEKLVPAIRRWRTTGRRRAYWVRLDECVFGQIDGGHDYRSALRPLYKPMVTPPVAWTSGKYGNGVGDEGGYLAIRTPLVSKPHRLQKNAYQDADLSRPIRALNAINSQPWRINSRTLAVLNTLWESGGAVAGLPLPHDDPLPPRVDNPDELQAWKRAAAIVYTRNHHRRGERQVFLNRRAVANDMATEPRLWFPHKFDFRTRCYPIPAELNHQGEDVSRGLLEFGVAGPVDEDQLKIHAANCWGEDKVPYADRIAWANRSAGLIQTILSDPVGNVELWSSADKPWQFLAACYALDDDRAAKYAPTHVDGSCNGLQHYAALGRDYDGAVAVNLVDSDTPQDVYRRVLDRVLDVVTADTELPQDIRSVLLPAINRTVVKQPVMTFVYGVTVFGANQQIRGNIELATEDKELKAKCVHYLTRKVFESIGDVCEAAKRVQDWITACASIHAENDRVVRWTTPLGFPVIQTYKSMHSVRIKTALGRVVVGVEKEDAPVMKRRQKQGAAPSFIHSLDATHMLNTGTRMIDGGMSFGGVHDSFWSHSGSMRTLHAFLREEFVAMHREPLLANLLSDFRTHNPDLEFPEPPAMGAYLISNALSAKYLFG